MENFYTVKEVCELLHVGPSTVYRWIAGGYLSAAQVQRPFGKLLFRESILKNLVSSVEEAQKRLKELRDKKNAKRKSRP